MSKRAPGLSLDVITTTLRREPFADILAGTKRVEYREIKPYWTKRLKRAGRPFKLVLRNGMNPPVPILTVLIDRVTPNPARAPRRGIYSLHIARVLKVEHWDRRRAKPR